MNQINLLLIVFLLLGFHIRIESIPLSSATWEELEPPDGTKFTPRRLHANAVFRDRIWLTGGFSETHPIYNFQTSIKEMDVWSSADGQKWEKMINITGDFYKQNTDVKQPGDIAPWYQRFGHTMDTVYTDPGVVDTVGGKEVMIILGGYAPGPMNDQWVTKNGWEWVYAEFSSDSEIWTPRAWHKTVYFKGNEDKPKLYMLGGSPLTNEIWRLETIKEISRADVSNTRSMYMKYTFELKWEKIRSYGLNHWSPRVGFGIFDQYYFNPNAGETVDDSKERLILVGGYGGFPKGAGINNAAEIDLSGGISATYGLYDGYSCRSDVWESRDGQNWTQIATTTLLGKRSWFGYTVWHHPNNINIDVAIAASNISPQPPRMWVFGGGNLGFTTGENAVIRKIDGRSDGLWSRDGISWYSINYVEGGGTSTAEFYSSQEWSKTLVDGTNRYLGVWGHNVQRFAPSNGANRSLIGTSYYTNPTSYIPEALYFLGGDYTGLGPVSDRVFRSLEGIFCDNATLICGGHAESQCGNSTVDTHKFYVDGGNLDFEYVGCICPELPVDGFIYTGEFCTIAEELPPPPSTEESALGTVLTLIFLIVGAVALVGLLYSQYSKG